MKTVVLYNIISFIILVALIFVLRIVSKSSLRQNQQLVIKVIATILIVCVIAFVLFIDAIAVSYTHLTMEPGAVEGIHSSIKALGFQYRTVSADVHR